MRIRFSYGSLAQNLYFLSGLLFLMSLHSIWDQLGTRVFLMGSALMAYLVARRLGQARQMEEQVSADLEANELFEQLLQQSRSGDAPPFFLYLRPFELTGKILVHSAEHPAKEWNEWAPGAIDLEIALTRAVEPIPLLALGEPGEHVGAGRILRSERDWESAVELLAREAKGILVLPSSRPGTLWEINLICGLPSLREKTIFIQGMAAKVEPWDRVIDLGVEWEKAAAELRKGGIELPPYEGFMLFTLDADGQVRDQVKDLLLLGTAKKAHAAIKRLLSGVSGQ